MTREQLRREAVVFGRYLVGEVPSDVLIERYCAANEELFAHEVMSSRDAAALELVRRRAWTAGPLDAGHALIARGSLLRKKLLVMTAIVETTPAYAARMEPRAVSLPGLVVRLVGAGLAMAAQAAAGVALTVVLRRGR
jgi:hypothetical protein